MMKKFRAIIDMIDKDYHAFAGTKEIQVDSWEEAENYCYENEWSGYSFMVYGLIDDSIKEGYFSRKEFRDANSCLL
ncbi:MAG: hypothetical protein ACRC0G_08865 [Fusobacteriaceae bacterium]